MTRLPIPIAQSTETCVRCGLKKMATVNSDAKLMKSLLLRGVIATGKELAKGSYAKVFEVNWCGITYAAKEIHSLLRTPTRTPTFEVIDLYVYVLFTKQMPASEHCSIHWKLLYEGRFLCGRNRRHPDNSNGTNGLQPTNTC